MVMKYETLASVLEQIATMPPHVIRYNCEEQTLQWIKETFQKPLQGAILLETGFFGTPLYEVRHLQYGFIEAEMSDGTRKIIDLTTKNKEASISGKEGV